MNRNVENIQISGIRRFYNRVSKVDGAISLTLGQPDFSVPKKIEESMIDAIKQGKTVYTPNAGILELRQAISEYLKTLHINYSAEETCVTIGGSEALFSIFTALINPGDKVLIPSPAYPAYESIAKILGGEVINYSLNDDFTLNCCELDRLIKEHKVKFVVLSYPCNPTGAVLTKEDRDTLSKIVADNDITIITDEIYAALCYDEYYSIAQCDDLKEKIIYVSGFSKMFSMTGLRIGYFCAAEKYMKEIMKVHQYNVSCATSIVQWGVVTGLKECLVDVEKMKGEFRKRRDYVYERLVSMGFEVVKPRGAFYIFPSIKKFNMSSEEFCLKVLNDKKVACVPGDAFGAKGEGFIRISYCYSIDELNRALSLIEEWVKGM